MPATTDQGPWFKAYPQVWLTTTRDLTLEQRGAYWDVLCLMYDRDGPLPDNDYAIAGSLHISSRKWRIVKKALVSLGKLREISGFLHDDLAEKTMRSRREVREKVSKSATEREKQKELIDKKPNKNNNTTSRTETKPNHEAGPRVLESKNPINNPKSVSLPSTFHTARQVNGHATHPGGIDLDFVRQQVTAAAGASLALDAEGLRDISQIMARLGRGDSLALDIVPAVRAKAAALQPGCVRSWKYFAGPIDEWVQARKEGTKPRFAARAPQKTYEWKETQND